jgi:16S rRNA G966 N2-methylase RsmD
MIVTPTSINAIEFPIANIIIGQHKRVLFDVSALAQSIKERGLLHPITILPDGTLVSGYHRLEACKSLGWQMIPVVRRAWDELHAELAEIDEQIIRSELKEIERSRHLQRRKEMYESLHPETKQGGDRKSHGKVSHVMPSFVEDTANKTGIAVRTIRTHTQIASSIPPALDAAILATSIADNQQELLKLARMAPEQQQAVIEKLTGPEPARSVRQATVQLNQEKRQEPLALPITQEDYTIHHCAVADFAAHVQAESLDAIITDPPYPGEFLPVYADLAAFATHALKPGGSLIVMVGQYYLPEILDRLRQEPLRYHWLASYYTPGGTTKIWPRKIGAAWKPLLWFVKGKYTGTITKDVLGEGVFVGNGKDKQHHKWGQPVEDMIAMLEHFTQPGQLICDPFVGSGSTALAALATERRFIGCDIDVQCVQTARQRIQEAEKGRQNE